MKLLYFLVLTIFLTGCASSKLIHENKYSVTYQHRDDKFSTYDDSSHFIREVTRDAVKKCQEKGFRTAQKTNSQCTQYCARNSECVCITNFACK